MKRILSYISLIIPLTLFFTSGLWYFAGPLFGQPTMTLAPIPDFLRLSENKQVTFLDLWLPFVDSNKQVGDIPSLTAESVLMYDLDAEKVLFQKNPDDRLPMASLTKIMTAIIALENPEENDVYVVSQDAMVGENSMGLSPGEIVTQEDLLYGLLLPSGNDAAEVLAQAYPGGRDAFIQAMNDKARALGLTDTSFTNPSGLQGDGEQYTTSYDLLVITRYALETFPLFREIVATAEYTIAPTADHKGFTLENETNLITSYPGVKGVKTGYTPEAGLCLVTYLEYEDKKILGVILNSEDRRGEMKELLDYSLIKQGVTPPPYEEPLFF